MPDAVLVQESFQFVRSEPLIGLKSGSRIWVGCSCSWAVVTPDATEEISRNKNLLKNPNFSRHMAPQLHIQHLP